MRHLRAWFFRLAGLVGGHKKDLDVADELQSHVQMHVDEFVRSGVAPNEARRRALVKLGGLDQVQEEYRAHQGFAGLASVLADLRYALRLLRHGPGFAFVALASLSLGIGANCAIFNTARAMFWRQLPVLDPQSLVLFKGTRRDLEPKYYLPATLAERLRDAGCFSDIITRDDDGLSFSIDGGRAERIVGEVDSTNFFSVLGVHPMLGPGFSDQVQAGIWAPEVVLSYRFWKRRFGADPSIIGRTIDLNDYPFTVVGVTPRDFCGLMVGQDPELRLPAMPPGSKLGQMELVSDDYSEIAGRLKPGMGIERAQGAVQALFQGFLRDNPELQSGTNPMIGLEVLPGNRGFQQDLSGFRGPVLVLFGLAGLVLLIACTNLASMLLARSTARRRELAIRAALGAGRRGLIRQMLLESLLLAIIGGALGVGVASWTGAVLFGFLPQGHIATELNIAPDAASVWFAIGITIAAALITGLPPALNATSGALIQSLKGDKASSIGGGRGLRLRRGLLVAQVAVTLLLVSVAGLFQGSLDRLRSRDGFTQPNRVLLFTLKPQRELYDAKHMLTLTANIESRMSALPGVAAAALAEHGPLGSRQGECSVRNSAGRLIQADYDRVSSGYFQTIGIPLASGRDFSFFDKADSQPVVIINESLARQLFPGEEPLGKIIRIRDDGSLSTDDGFRPVTIVGVVQDRRYYDLHAAPAPQIFTCIQQAFAYMPTLHVRMEGDDEAATIAAVLREFNSIDTNFPVFNIRTLADRQRDSLASERLLSQLAAIFGVVAALLAIIGIYGVVSYSVARRAREIGIRMALGASSGSMLRMVFTETLLLVVGGITVGVPATAAAAKIVSSQLPGTGAVEPATVFAAAVLMFGVAMLAGFLPARRASRVDPLVALRYE
ncbi:MAG TPA: ABC transporter permease [Blastocatellia bacterium]